MKQTHRLRATGWGLGVAYLICALLLCAFLFLTDHRLPFEDFIDGFVALILLWEAFLRLSHPVFLTDDGAVRYRFGAPHLQLSWHEIAQIAKIEPHLLPSKSSYHLKIILVPQDCPLYAKGKWGSKYIVSHHRRVIVIDNLDANIAFIRQHYGEIEDFTDDKWTFKRRKE